MCQNGRLTFTDMCMCLQATEVFGFTGADASDKEGDCTQQDNITQEACKMFLDEIGNASVRRVSEEDERPQRFGGRFKRVERWKPCSLGRVFGKDKKLEIDLVR